MKKSTFTLSSLMLCALFISPQFSKAQQNQTPSTNQVYIVQTITDEDGTVKKTVVKDKDVSTYLEELSDLNIEGENLEINIRGDIEDANDETILFVREARSDNSDGDDLHTVHITVGESTDVNNVGKSTKRALLGIYSEKHEDGVLITRIVPESGAEKAGLISGDIITALDGQTMIKVGDITRAISAHQPGETIQVNYLRNGSPAQLTATLGEKKSRSYNYNYNYRYNHSDNAYSRFKSDPCAIFIGIYSNRHNGGMKISKVIEGTSADRANLQRGDIIYALDDVLVRSHQELVRERDKHEPGDMYVLRIERDGELMEIDAEFKVCDEETEEVAEEIVEVVPEELVQPTETPSNTLELKELSVFPNPSTGPINLRFQAEAKPTTIRVADATGKVLFEEVINNFDGQYSKSLDLGGATPGTLILSIVQDQQIYTQSLVIMPRA